VKSITQWIAQRFIGMFGLGQEPIPQAKDERRTILEGKYIYRITRKQRLIRRADDTTGAVVLWDVRRMDSVTALNQHAILTEIVTPRGVLVRHPTTAQLIYAIDRHFDAAQRSREMEALMSSHT
jgi:hypothetical protein